MKPSEELRSLYNIVSPTGERMIQFYPHGPMTSIDKLADRVEKTETKLEVLEHRLAGNELCEAHGDWLPMDVMHRTHDGVYLCQEAWDELAEAIS